MVVSFPAVCGRRVPPVVVAAGSLQHKTLPPVVMAQPVVVPPTKLKVLHAGALTHSQRLVHVFRQHGGAMFYISFMSPHL